MTIYGTDTITAKVRLTKSCRVTDCGRLTSRTRLCTPCTALVEQRLAFGDLPHEAARRIGTTTGDVIRVGEHMDAAAKSTDDTRSSAQKCFNGLHEMSPDNLTPSRNGVTCRACKRASNAESMKRRRERRKAA